MHLFKTNFFKIFLLLFLGILLTSCQSDAKKKQENTNPATSSAEKDSIAKAYLLIPGKQFGTIQINGNADKALADLPKPDFGDAAMGKVLMRWNNFEGDSLFMFNTQQMGVEDFKRIKIIRSFSNKYKTKEGIGVGSSLADIQNHFNLENQGTITENSKNYTLYQDKGIGFEIDENQICRAVLIFSKDYSPINSYLPFYNDMQ